jgi:TRAP-type C4-dicarboxylate transport system permease small subunit
MKIVRFLDRIIDILSKVALFCGGALLMVMAINITYGVLARYLFNAPSVYAMDLTKILMIPALVLAVSYVQRYNRHLQVDFLSARFPEKVQLILLEIIVPIAGLFVGYILVWKGWTAMVYARSINEVSYSSWGEPMWPVKLMIPIGYGLLCLVLIAQVCKGIARLVHDKGEVAESPDVTAESERV